MSSFPCLISTAFLLILLSPGQVVCHTKGLWPGQRQPSMEYSKNATQSQLIEKQFMRWVRYVGGLRHSVFNKALNKVIPSYILTVDKNPSKGDFTSIQEAIDLLPYINLVRVVIKVNAVINK